VHFHASFTLQTCTRSSKWYPSSHTVTHVSYRKLTVAKILHLHCLFAELGANNVHWQWQKQWHVTHLLIQVHSVCPNSKHGSTTHRKQSHFSQKKCILFTSLQEWQTQLPYFPTDNAHLTYNAHPKLFYIPFEVQITRTKLLWHCVCTCAQII